MYDVGIIGAGPVGLAAAIEAKKLGLSYVIFEKGCVVNTIFRYPTYMTFFTTSDLLEIGGHPLVATHEKPDRREALQYYRLVTERENLNIRQYCTVKSIKKLDNAFILETETKNLEKSDVNCKNIVIATGYFDKPNMLNVPGEDLNNVSHYYTEPHAFYRLKVTIIGAGNSAAKAALELYRHGAEVTIVHRGPEMKESVKYWVKPDIENRIQDGLIRAYFNASAKEFRDNQVVIEQNGQQIIIPSDFTFALTGYHPNNELIAGLGAKIDRDGCVEHNSNTFESNVKGLYVVGSAAFGRFTNQVFIENGREHAVLAVRDIKNNLIQS